MNKIKMKEDENTEKEGLSATILLKVPQTTVFTQCINGCAMQ
jgi:hypothetical protein